jgi:two-component system sensor histidine kinase TctE
MARLTSFAGRLLWALVLPMTAFAVVMGTGGAVLIQTVVDRSADRLLGGAVQAIADTMTVEDGKVWVNVPPWALGVLDNPQRDRVFYSVRQSGVLLTGYADLPMAAAGDDLSAPRFRTILYKGIRVRQSLQTVMLAGGGAPITVSVAQSLDSRHSVRNELMGGLLLLEGLMIVLASCLVWPAVRWNLRPLEAIRQQLTERRSSNGQHYRAVSLDAAPDEIRPLLQAFNAVLLDLDQVNERAQRFTADASHQMRTPLATLKTHLAVMSTMGDRSEADRAALADAREATDRLGGLLVQLLALARADNVTTIELRPVDLAALVRTAVDDTAVALDSHGAELICQLPRGPVTVMSSEALLTEILANLLNNAVRYGEGRAVAVHLETEGDGAVIHIDDQGPGIPESSREIVFDRFSRLASTQHIGGSGLGLSIVRALADRLGIRLALTTNPLGHGLRVSIIVPQRRE